MFLKTDSMKFVRLPEAPSKLKLYDYLKVELEKNKELNILGFDEHSFPDKDFMVLLLFNLDAKHKIFSKSYLEKKEKESKLIKLGFPAEFFDDLPQLSPN